jgi:hypothetical protein
MSTVRSAAVAVTVAALLLAVHPGVRHNPSLYDEGNTVYAAWRVAEGQVLYRDLWTMHAPGTPHLLALIFTAFGTNIIVERALKLSLLGLLSALGYACFRRFLSPLAAATSVALALGARLDPALVPSDTALVAMLVALLATAAALGPGAPSNRLFLAGLLLGLTVWFRHDFGFYATAACTVTVALASWLPSRDDTAARCVARTVATLWLGVAVPVLAMVFYFFARGALGSMVQQMIVFPATTFASVRELPVPALGADVDGLPFGLLFWLTPPTLLAGAALSGLDLRRGARDASALLLVSLSGLFVFNHARVRADFVHLWPALVLAIPVFVALGTRAWRSALDRRRLLLGVVGGLLLASVGTFGVILTRAAYQALTATRPGRLLDAIPGTLPAVGVVLDPALEKALLFLVARVPAGAPVFVGNQRHDLISFNCSLCYFLLRRPSPTPYYNLHPGLATTEAVQREIVAQLEMKRIDWILLWEAPLGDALGRQDASGATDLDAYLASRYESAARYGRWEIRHRAGARPVGTSAIGSFVAVGGAATLAEELRETRLERARAKPDVPRQLTVIESRVLVQAEKGLRGQEGARAEERREGAGGQTTGPQRRMDP